MQTLMIPFTPRYFILTACAIFTVVLFIIGLESYKALEIVIIPMVLFGALTLLGVRDLLQKRHAVLPLRFTLAPVRHVDRRIAVGVAVDQPLEAEIDEGGRIDDQLSWRDLGIGGSSGHHAVVVRRRHQKGKKQGGHRKSLHAASNVYDPDAAYSRGGATARVTCAYTLAAAPRVATGRAPFVEPWSLT